MISVWAPGEMTMAISYASGENYARQDDSNYYDQWFNGTSAAAGPNACSVIALELQTNPKATQTDIHKQLQEDILQSQLMNYLILIRMRMTLLTGQ